MRKVVREVLDALLLIVILIALAFLVYYLQLPPEDRPSFAELIPGGIEVPSLAHTATPTGDLVLTPSAIQVSTSTVAPSPTGTSLPTATPTSSPASSSTPAPALTARLSVDQEINDGLERGDQIVEAIESYTSARGFYPATLGDLVPDYLPEVPYTITGQVFFYRVFERTTVMAPEIYWVSFRVVSQSNVTCTYYRRMEHWDCNFSSP